MYMYFGEFIAAFSASHSIDGGLLISFPQWGSRRLLQAANLPVFLKRRDPLRQA